MSKTGRKYGEAIGKAREILAAKVVVTIKDLPMPPKNAKNLLRHMQGRGEIKILSSKPGQPTVYGLRDAHPDVIERAIPERPSHFDAGLEALHSKAYPGERLTLEEIASACGVTRERIRQVESAALRKLRMRIAEDAGQDMLAILDRVFHRGETGRFLEQTRNRITAI
jgi:hypothetical protein